MMTAYCAYIQTIDSNNPQKGLARIGLSVIREMPALVGTDNSRQKKTSTRSPEECSAL